MTIRITWGTPGPNETGRCNCRPCCPARAGTCCAARAPLCQGPCLPRGSSAWTTSHPARTHSASPVKHQGGTRSIYLSHTPHAAQCNSHVRSHRRFGAGASDAVLVVIQPVVERDAQPLDCRPFVLQLLDLFRLCHDSNTHNHFLRTHRRVTANIVLTHLRYGSLWPMKGEGGLPERNGWF